jgi:hypothetical protein
VPSGRAVSATGANRPHDPAADTTSPRDLVVVEGVARLPFVVAPLACLLPARRAMRIDIDSVFREE